MRLTLPILILATSMACDEPAGGGKYDACPVDVPLTDDDLPCDCNGATVESLSCGDLICNSVGLTMGDTGGCGSTTTTTD